MDNPSSLAGSNLCRRDATSVRTDGTEEENKLHAECCAQECQHLFLVTRLRYARAFFRVFAFLEGWGSITFLLISTRVCYQSSPLRAGSMIIARDVPCIAFAPPTHYPSVFPKLRIQVPA